MSAVHVTNKGFAPTIENWLLLVSINKKRANCPGKSEAFTCLCVYICSYMMLSLTKNQGNANQNHEWDAISHTFELAKKIF